MPVFLVSNKLYRYFCVTENNFMYYSVLFSIECYDSKEYEIVIHMELLD